jgi:glycosyltransferase involved in cell wall biosynthesis
LGSNPVPAPFVSVVVTVRSEAAHLRQLLESLLVQEEPFEIVLVDALSRDGTWEIMQSFAERYPTRFRVFQKFGSRGIGRNAGVQAAKGSLVAFIDGDCIADSQWLHALRDGFRHALVVAGRTVPLGRSRFGPLERVELYQLGNDVTYPSCNLGYQRALFEQLGGFDPRFITAEDIDLNLRAVRAGASIAYVPNAIVYHYLRGTLVRFLLQAFWNGYGRKQLTEKQGSLWGNYRLSRLIQNQRSPIAWARISAALGGYFARVVTGVGERLTALPVEPNPRDREPTPGTGIQ